MNEGPGPSPQSRDQPERPAPASALPDEPLGLRADLPIALMPIRIETRLQWSLHQDGHAASVTLRLRMYPDQIHVDSHEPALTDAECADGQRYWHAFRDHPADQDLLRAAWQQLSDRWGAGRAAWIARVTEPRDDGGLPAPERAAEQWTSPALARALPTTWYVSGRLHALSGTAGDIVFGQVISAQHALRPLPISFDPAEPPPGDDDPAVPTAIRWTADFSEAVAAGMAAEIQLPDLPLADGAEDPSAWEISRLVVFGLDLLSDEKESAQTLADLFEAHYHTEGLSFVASGTPTNNTETARAGLEPAAPSERTARLRITASDVTPSDADGNACRLGRALGLPLDDSHLLAATRRDEPLTPARPAGLARAVGATDGEETAARAMNTVLWSASWGAYLFTLLAPPGDGEQDQANWAGPGGAIDWARRLFQDAVRALGPLPALRAADQPYGILPVASIGHWDHDADPQGAHLAAQLQTLLHQIWLPATDKVPTFRTPGDPVKTFLNVFSLSPYAVEYQGRHLLGRELLDSLRRLLDDYSPLTSPNAAAPLDFLRRGLGPGWVPPLATMTFSADAHPITLPLVTAGSSGTAPLSEYADRVLGYLPPRATPAPPQPPWLALRDDPPGGAPLLHRLVRHSALTALSTGAFRRPEAQQFLDPHPYDLGHPYYEPELPGIFPPAGAGGPIRTLWSLLDQPAADGGSVGQSLYRQPPPELTDFTSALTTLQHLPAATLERHLVSTLDLASHRLDAWITSLAWRRLDALRSQDASRRGVYLGTYGWIEHLPLQTTPPAGAYGYHHAPSLPQAVTAAVLQSAHLTALERDERQGWPEPAESVSIDLPSHRARQAAWLLDAIRQGQSLPAALGYRFERWLQETIADGSSLGTLIDDFRQHYPLQGTLVQPDGTPPVTATASTVVTNGVRLHAATCTTCGGNPKDALAFLPQTDHDAVLPLVARLHDLVDSLGDALLAESVHHAVGGSPLRAGAAADVLAGSGRPPDRLDFLTTPRTGPAVTHRLLLATADPWPDVQEDQWPERWQPPQRPEGQPAPWQQRNGHLGPHQARAYAEPTLNALAADLLPSPDTVACRLKWSPAIPAGSPAELTLAELADPDNPDQDKPLSPLDMLYVAAASKLPPGPGRPAADPDELAPELAVRIRDKLRTYPGVLSLDFGRAADWSDTKLSVNEFLEVARSAARLLLGARPLQSADLHNPAAPPQTAAGQPGQTLQHRSAGAEDRLNKAIELLSQPANPEEGLRAAAALAVDGCYPDPRWDDARLSAAAAQASKELQNRKARLGGQTDAAARIQTVFGATGHPGKSFPVLAPLVAENASSLAQLAQASSRMQQDAHFDILCWLQGAASTRRGVQSLLQADTYREALTGQTPPLTVIQLAGPADRWIALSTLNQPGQGGLSIVIQTPAGEPADALFTPPQPSASPPPAPDQAPAIAGLFIDAWTETLPADTQTTGLAVRADTPNATAPQAILLAVTPPRTQAWTVQLLEQTLHDVIDLVHARGVDPDLLGETGHFLPAITLTCNAAGHTISTDLFEEHDGA